MNPNSLNQRVTLQQLTSAQDDIGETVQAWSTVATVWADIRYLRGVEAIKANAETSIVNVSIRIRYRDDITTGMRAVHGATAYSIKAVLPDMQRKEYTDLVCERVNG